MKRAVGLTMTIVCVGGLLPGCTFGGHGDDLAESASCSAEASATPIPKYNYRIDNKVSAPVKPVPDAKRGGTVRVYDVVDYQHLDPARIYVNNLQTLSQLLTRQLTGYLEDGTNIKLVGDLATDTGKSSNGNRTWTYTLRPGITWEDGSPVTSADVKYGLEREFVEDYSEGPTYLQTWFAGTQDFHSVYKGPYDGKELDAIQTPDDKTVVLNFKEAQPDVPFAMALQGAPVKKSKDTRGDYDLKPFSNGPYKIASHNIDRNMVLVRNTAWKGASDPIRTDYPDRFEFTFGETPLDTNRRLIAAVGADAAAMTVVDGVSPEVLDKVLNRPDLLARSVSGLTQFTSYVVFNLRRMTDIRVRKAVMYAYPRCQLRQLVGGPDTGDFAGTLSSPTLVGHEDSDLFQVPPGGDPQRARALLKEAGKLGTKLVMPYNASSRRGQQAGIITTQALEKAGFKVIKKAVDPKDQDLESDPSNPFDVYAQGWAADWPSGSTVYPPLFDGRLIVDGPGNTDQSFFKDDAINKQMDAIRKIADPIEAGKRWAALDRAILQKLPVFPDTYLRSRQLYGPRLGHVTYDNIYGEVSLNGLYVK
ncbi:MAG TPA: ABC transporter substrate-binding protein [Sporichthyaceae bacterium]|jgi:peptide/nickel transport system substrate-binding protein